MRFVWIAAGGALGSAARWGVAQAFAGAGGPWPFATLLVNGAGAFALGWLYARASDRDKRSPAYQAAAAGFLGAFTTMSAFGLEAWTMLEGERYGLAAAYIALTAAVGPPLARAGLRLGALRRGEAAP
ncbi:CrcB family protein [Paenibacillus sp.]|uniref:FluC/FEX family fluoride channel n=1 Tax=Paenibacillus sp. TaxID=58172 RepID=UPI002D5FDC60|nr:CrcB family protein [Paenibacillus sp.]HZG84520.1 CrcB family protein [Paenibacillus sp.]